MARPVYQYRPRNDDPDSGIGLLLPFNKGAKGKAPQTHYASGSITGNGVFELSYTTEEQVISNLKNLLLTTKGERLMQPNFGTSMRTIIFENNTPELRDLLFDAINEDIEYWLPYVKLKAVDIGTSEDRHTLIVTLRFRIESIGAEVVINVLASENAFTVQEISEEDFELQQVGTFGADTFGGLGDFNTSTGTY
jgi:phage baseplate assembly protein W